MQIRTATELGALVRDRRQAAAWSQAALASRAGVSRRWLAALEGGKASSELGLVLRTLDALGLAISIEAAGTATGDVDLDAVLRDFDEGVG